VTGNQTIASALRLIGAISAGETPTSQEATDALFVCNQMLDSWNAEGLMIYAILRTTFTLVVNQQVYTLGIGGNVSIQRPARIERVSIIQQPLATQPLELPMAVLTYDQWQQIPVKNTPTSLPQAVYPDMAFPLINLNFWGVPTAPQQIALYTWTPLPQFNALTADLELPPGYAEAIRWNLALRLGPEWLGTQFTTAGLIAPMAASSKAIVKSINIVPLLMTCDQAVVNPKGGYYNWISDTPAGVPA
jgi:hypothetical protein